MQLFLVAVSVYFFYVLFLIDLYTYMYLHERNICGSNYLVSQLSESSYYGTWITCFRLSDKRPAVQTIALKSKQKIYSRIRTIYRRYFKGPV